MSQKDLDTQRYLTLKKELEREILAKLKTIEEKVLTKTSGSHATDVQVLIMVQDELDDVLLNWEDEVILSSGRNSGFDLDEEDDF